MLLILRLQVIFKLDDAVNSLNDINRYFTSCRLMSTSTKSYLKKKCCIYLCHHGAYTAAKYSLPHRYHISTTSNVLLDVIRVFFNVLFIHHVTATPQKIDAKKSPNYTASHFNLTLIFNKYILYHF